MKKCLLVFSADPGGAECLCPVLQSLPEEIEAKVICKGFAVRIFERCSACFSIADGLTFGQIEEMLEGMQIDAVMTSSSSLPEKDMTEKLLWKWAERKNVPSIAVSDQWQNYARRFSGIDENEYLKYMPDIIAIQDEMARHEMLMEGLPENRLRITGQPALEAFSKQVSAVKGKRSGVSLRGHKEGAVVITFFSQPVFDYFGDALGYTEKMVLEDILSVIPMLEEKWDRKIEFICKLHPKDRKQDLLPENCGLAINFVSNEYSNAELIAGSDMVIGMGSIMMVHSVVAGVPTVCYEPNKKSDVNTCFPVKVNAIPCITEKKELFNILNRLRSDIAFNREYLEQQKLCSSHEGAAEKVVSLIHDVMNIGHRDLHPVKK